MTKKDYQAIARAIYGVWSGASAAHGQTIILVRDAVADVLAADNPRFDRARFVEACETGRCKGMPR